MHGGQFAFYFYCACILLLVLVMLSLVGYLIASLVVGSVHGVVTARTVAETNALDVLVIMLVVGTLGGAVRALFARLRRATWDVSVCRHGVSFHSDGNAAMLDWGMLTGRLTVFLLALAMVCIIAGIGIALLSL